MDLTQLITSAYYFDANPGGDFLTGFVLLGFFIALMFATQIVRSIGPDNKYFRKSMKKKFWVYPFLGVIGTILVLARFGGVPGFSMRAWLFGTLLVSLSLGVRTLWRVHREYTRRKTSAQREAKKFRK